MISKRTLKLIKSLQQKKYRKKYNLFIVEGGKNVQELLSANFSIRTLIATPVFLEAQKDFIKTRNFLEIIETEEKQLSIASTFKSNNAALALVEIPESIPYISDKNNYELVLDDVKDPGNLGTILRIADWYGITNVICSPETTDVYSPKVVSASMGSFLRVKVFYRELNTFFQQNKKTVYGAYAEGGENVHTIEFEKEGILVMGSESHGVRPLVEDFVNHKVHIPSYGKAESLNVGIATSVICDNIKRVVSNL